MSYGWSAGPVRFRDLVAGGNQAKAARMVSYRLRDEYLALTPLSFLGAVWECENVTPE